MIPQPKKLSRAEFDNYAHLHTKMRAVRVHVSKKLPEDKKREFFSNMIQKEKLFLHKMMGWI